MMNSNFWPNYTFNVTPLVNILIVVVIFPGLESRSTMFICAGRHSLSVEARRLYRGSRLQLDVAQSTKSVTQLFVRRVIKEWQQSGSKQRR